MDETLKNILELVELWEKYGSLPSAYWNGRDDGYIVERFAAEVEEALLGNVDIDDIYRKAIAQYDADQIY
jgi:hypothetical protein